ncbi:SWIM zinc finger family protein [Brevibacillus reuszeri]|uniref:SWIM zinc finger family protein n=1 Tax=Brevibacillus reuszeri TaxID=54915 RepID=UPI00289F04E2|nr:SWIM zinc finger family protein [Brevibacillus reuszeri]
MLQRELTRDQANQVGEQILAQIEGHIIERGYHYFSDGVVFNTRVEKGTILLSDVQGSAVYHVALDLDAVQNSTCSCPYSRLCKHIAATFFQMYSVFENPRHFLARAQKPRRVQFSKAMLTPAYKNGSQLIAGSEAHAVQSSLTATSTVRDWWAFFESWTRNLSAAMETYRASTELFSSYQNVLGVAASWPSDRAQLFAIHANLFHLLTLQEFVKKYRQSFWYLDLTQTAERLLEQLEASLYYADLAGLRQNHAEAVKETLLIVKRMKSDDSSSLYWSFAYHMMWWYLLHDQSWVLDETSELDQLIHNPETKANEKERYLLLRALFYVMEHNDEAALRIWLPNRQLTLSFYLTYLKSFARENDWPRFLFWMEWLEQLVGQAETGQYRLVTAIWLEAMEQTEQLTESGAMLKRFLPNSFHEYATYLYENKRYKQWIDLHMSYQVPLSDITAAQAKEIEDSVPALLFPLYLREVNRLINERNRPAYKEAIKLLKKVRSAYSKANEEARFERYVDQLSAKYNRLRAFQEELRRGNLNL